MSVLLPFAIPAAALSVIFCLARSYTGLVLAAMLIVMTAAFFAAALLVYALFIVVLSVFAGNGQEKKYSPLYGKTVTSFMGVACALSNVRIHVSGLDKIPQGQFLFVSNHISGFDPLVSGWALRRRRLAFVSKPENMALPVVGRMCRRACFLAIDRENDRAALRTILDAAELMREGEVSFGIYPEGTRSRTGEMLPFRSGAFKIAQRAKAPIVVATVRGTNEIARRAPLRKTDVYLDIRAVIPTEEVCAAKTTELGERIRGIMLCESD